MRWKAEMRYRAVSVLVMGMSVPGIRMDGYKI